MKSYIIDSVDLQNCSKSDLKTLNKLKLCNNCEKLPIPAYKSYKNQDLTFCRSCYYKLDYKEKHLLKSTDMELELLGELILNCKNPVCNQQFDLNSIEEMVLHELKCRNSDDNLRIKKCKRCFQFYSNFKKHDCITELKKEQGYFNSILQKHIQEQFSHQNDTFNKRINELEEKLQSQEQTIIKLSKKLNKVEKVNKAFESILRENKKITRDNKDQLSGLKQSMENQACIHNTENKVIMKKLFETEKNIYFERLVKLFNCMREGSSIDPILENQVMNSSFDFNSFKLSCINNNNEFLKFEKGELYNIEYLYKLLHSKSDFLSYKDVLICQEEMYQVYEIDLIKGINIEALEKRVSSIKKDPFILMLGSLHFNIFIEEFIKECEKLPILINIDRKQMTLKNFSSEYFINNISFIKPDKINLQPVPKLQFFKINDLIKLILLDFKQFQEKKSLPNIVFDSTIKLFKINSHLDNDKKEIVYFYSCPNTENLCKKEKIDLSKNFILNSLNWNLINSRLKSIIYTKIKDKIVNKNTENDSLLNPQIPNMELKDHYENINYLREQINELIDDINKEIKPFWFQISNSGRNFFFELLFSGYWSSISN
jgi:hypothetical protein